MTKTIITLDYESSDTRVNYGQVLQASLLISDDKANAIYRISYTQ